MAVFAGKRILENNVFGTTTNNPLTNVATTINSAALANLPAVSGDHAALVLDPLRTAGAPEIVIVTAHTAAATSATITRGAYGTAARQHAAGTLWTLATTKDDLIRVLTSSTRPTDTYEGQLIFEADTNRYMGFGGVDWAPRDAGGYLGYAEASVNQTLLAGVAGVDTDMTSVTTTVTVGTGRRVKVTVWCLAESTIANDEITVNIKQDGTRIKLINVTVPVANRGHIITGEAVLSPTAGAHTYKATVLRSIGTGQITVVSTSDREAYILAEDIGAA